MSDAGEIVGRLRLDAGNWFEELDRAEAKARELGAVDPKVRVSTDGAGRAVTELEAVSAAEKQVESGARSISAAQKDGQRQAADWRGALIGGLVAVAAAAPPVAAGAVGITGALGAMGAAGVVALTGISRGLKDNNTVGQLYRGTVGDLTADLHALQDSAAQGLFPGVQQSTALLNSQMPTLDGYVQHFASMLGADLPVGLDAVVTLLERSEPLFDSAGQYAGTLLGALDRYAHGNGFTSFLEYAQRNLPEVKRFLGDTGHLVGDFISAWAPLGTETLPMLDGLVTGVDDIVRHTGPLVPAIIAVVGAYKLLSPAVSVVQALTAATIGLGEAQAAAGGAGAAGGGALGALGVGAAGAVGLGVAIPGFLGTAGNVAASKFGVTGTAGRSARDAERLIAQTTGTAAGGSSIGAVINNPLRGVMNSGLGGAFTSASGGAGFIDTQTSRNLDALDKTFAAMAKDGNIKQASAMVSQFAQANHLSTAQVKAAFPVFEQEKGALADTANGSKTAGAQVDSLTAAWTRSSAAVAKSSSTYQTQQGALLAAQDAIAGVTASVKQNGTALDDSSASGRANEEVMLSAVQAIQAHGQSLNADGQHAAAAAVSNDKMAISLINTAVKAGISRAAAESYVNKLLGIPKGVSTTVQLHKDEAEAEIEHLKASLAGIRNKDVFINVYEAVKSTGATDAAAGFRAAQSAKNALLGGAHGGTAGDALFGAVPHLAAGGTITGAGTAATDTAGIFRLANTEEVVSNLYGGADRFRPLLKGISAGTVRTPAQAAAAVGAAPQAQTQVLQFHFTDDGSVLGVAMRQIAENAIGQQTRRTRRLNGMGLFDRSLGIGV